MSSRAIQSAARSGFSDHGRRTSQAPQLEAALGRIDRDKFGIVCDARSLFRSATSLQSRWPHSVFAVRNWQTGCTSSSGERWQRHSVWKVSSFQYYTMILASADVSPWTQNLLAIGQRTAVLRCKRQGVADSFGDGL